MARVETGHIHLHSSILHHTEGLETKSVKKKKDARTHRNTRTAIGTPACVHTNTENALKRLSYKKHMQPFGLQQENLRNRKHRLYFILIPTKNFTDRRTHIGAHTQTHTETHDPLSSRKWWNMKWSITAWNGSLPRTVLVLCHIVFYCQKKRRGRNRGKETVNSEKQVRHIEISFFSIIYYWDFLYGNSRRFQQLSKAQPVVWQSAQAFHMYEVWQRGKQPPT